jgi:hypothetical protein
MIRHLRRPLDRRSFESGRGQAVIAAASVAALVVGVLAAMVGATISQAASANQKVFVCKYVGTPGVDERLKPGENPISVSSSATVGSVFNDAQGRSFVVALDEGQPPPSCPPVPPGGEPTCTSTPTSETSATAEASETTTEETRPAETETATTPASPSQEPSEEATETETPPSPSGATESPTPVEPTSPSGAVGTSATEAGSEPSSASAQPGAGSGQCGEVTDRSPGATSSAQPSAEAQPESTESATAVPTGSTAGLRGPIEQPDAAGANGGGGDPDRLLVPRIGLDARIVRASVSNGLLQPPVDPTTVGWWTHGRRPGAAHGRTLLTAHAVHTGGGAFDDLGTLRAGDAVSVHTSGGLVRYTVTAVHVWPTALVAHRAPHLFRQSGRPGLVLVGCAGWDGLRFTETSVVVADAAE